MYGLYLVVVLASLDEYEEDSADEQGDCYGKGFEKVFFDGVVEEESEGGGGQDGEENFSPKVNPLLCLVIDPERRYIFPEVEQDGTDGGQLNDDVEGFGETCLCAEIEEALDEDEVAGAANGEELCDAFDGGE